MEWIRVHWSEVKRGDILAVGATRAVNVEKVSDGTILDEHGIAWTVSGVVALLKPNTKRERFQYEKSRRGTNGLNGRKIN
jgi:hypothetical protein